MEVELTGPDVPLRSACASRRRSRASALRFLGDRRGWNSSCMYKFCRHGDPSRPAGRLRGAAQPLPRDGQCSLRGLHGALEEHEVRDHLLVGVSRPLRRGVGSCTHTSTPLLPVAAPVKGLGKWHSLKATPISPGPPLLRLRAFPG